MSHLQSQSSELDFELSHEQQKSDSNLLDSLTPTPTKNATHKKNRKSEQKKIDDDEFLGNMEEALSKGDNSRKMSKQQILLQAQVIQLQMKCNSLAAINSKLVNNLNPGKTDSQGSIKDEDNEGSNKNNNSVDNSCLMGDITQMQTQFTEIQDILNAYRSQLTAYQNQICQESCHREEIIDALNQEIRELESENYLKEKECHEMKKNLVQVNRENQLFIKENNLLRKKNQQLIIEMQGTNMELEKLQKWKRQWEKQKVFKYGRQNHNQSNKQLRRNHRYTGNSIYNSLSDETFEDENDKKTENDIILQMENIINQLASQLEYERQLSKKYTIEIKRINEELRKQQMKIQRKNEEIYNLEKEILDMKKSIIQGQKKKNMEDQTRRSEQFRKSLDKYSERPRKNISRQKEEVQQKTARQSQKNNLTSLQKIQQSNQFDNDEKESEIKYISADRKQQALQSSKISQISNITPNPMTRINNPTKKPILSADIYNNSPQKNNNISQNKNNEIIPTSMGNKDDQSHRKTLSQICQQEPQPLLILILCKRILQLYTETEQKNMNRTAISFQNLQIYNLFVQNVELMRVRMLHSHPGNTLLSKQDYFYNILHLLLSLIQNYSFQKVESLLNELQQHPLNSRAKNMAAHFTYVRLAIDSAITKIKKERINSSGH